MKTLTSWSYSFRSCSRLLHSNIHFTRHQNPPTILAPSPWIKWYNCKYKAMHIKLKHNLAQSPGLAMITPKKYCCLLKTKDHKLLAIRRNELVSCPSYLSQNLHLHPREYTGGTSTYLCESLYWHGFGKMFIEKIFLDFSQVYLWFCEHGLNYKIGVFRCRTYFEYSHEAFGCEKEINLTNKTL